MSYASQYGNDFLLSNGDLLSNSRGDLFTAKDYELNNPDESRFEGYFNILIALTNRLLTIKGDDIFYPTYGSKLPLLLSSPNSPSLRQDIKAEVEKTLLEDDRVQKVDNITVEQIGNKAIVKANITLIGQDQSSPFIFPAFLLE